MTGVMTSAGSVGFFYASDSESVSSWRVEFQSTGACLSALHRSYGFPLRCVQAFTGSVSG